MQRGQQSARLPRRTLIIGIAFVIFITTLGMHYGSTGVTLCTSSRSTALPPPSKPPAIVPKPLLPFAKATDVAIYLNRQNAKIGLELGIQNGVFAETVLNVWKTPIKYYMVDAYKSQPNYRDFANLADDAQEKLYNKVKNHFQRFGNVAHLIRKTTQAAAAELPGNMDFIYVDARRDYCSVKSDIETYWSKLKVGGVMGGGAYVDEGPPGTDWTLCPDGTKQEGSVKRAVVEFVTKKKLYLQITYEDKPMPSWFVQKLVEDPPVPKSDEPKPRTS